MKGTEGFVAGRVISERANAVFVDVMFRGLCLIWNGQRTRHLLVQVLIDYFTQLSSPSFIMVRQQSSAAGVLALLQDPDIVFKRHALKALNPLVPQFWAEISEHIALMSVF